jgi:cyclopropane-fatty-acyl-phospholipid synthase
MQAETGPPTAAVKDMVIPFVRQLHDGKVKLDVTFWWGQKVKIRPQKPRNRRPVKIDVRNREVLERRLTQFSLAQAYVRKDIDIVLPDDESDRLAIFELRDTLPSGLQARDAARFVFDLVVVPPVHANRRAIGRHYSLPDEFFLTFLDRKYHFYSQCRFDDAVRGVPLRRRLEAAARAKADWMAQALQLGTLPTDHEPQLLDIGVGWGGLRTYMYEEHPEYRVTSLTLTKSSKAYVEHQEAKLNPRPLGPVCVEDFLEHRARGVYDAIVIFGVIEHIPNYRRFCERAWDALRPGGCLYLDASATREKYAGSPFTRRYTWTGPHSCLSLQDMVGELLLHGFTIEQTDDGTDDYAETMSAWAARLQAAHAVIRERWGEDLYRAFEIFLLGGAHALRTDRLQAYTVVARRPLDHRRMYAGQPWDPTEKERRGPRPGVLRRAGQSVAGLFSG